ncbi:unnamed protein product [Dicrocoelium dendriticum]|nr:unnamed protein product [Dicrocoelium dendriticum]
MSRPTGSTPPGLLPKSDKSLEHLKRFFNQAHLDKSLLAQLTRLTKPNCGCAQATSCMREILKRVDRSSSGKAPTADAQLNYVRSIKVLLERSAPVLFDREFGQELVTQMVVVRETESTSGLTHPFDLTRSLRLLYSLTVYFKKTLPTDEVMDYLVGILAHQPVMLEDSASAKGSHTSLNGSEQDPLTVQELALYILCWLMGGSNGLSDGDIQTQSRPVTRVSVTQFGGSEANLNERAADLLPLLSELCCNGMTFDFPPVPCCSGSGTQPKTLPTDEVMDYLVGILAHQPVMLEDSASAKGSHTSLNGSEQDPLTVQELALYILCWLMGGSNGLSDGDIQTQSRPVTRVSVTQFGGSEANLNERAADLLPLLSELCCNGMTFDFPPVPCSSGSGTQPVVPHTGARLNKAKTARGVPKQNTDSSSDASPISTDLYMAGLAWRRERRRAKLATQILLCMRKLAFRFRVNAYKASSLQPCVKLRRIDSVDEVDLDAGSVDAVDTTTSGDMGVPSPLERAIQSALDKVVENCLSCPTHSGNYVTCLTTLSRIALQLPLVYNREFKRLITKTLVQHVLARDEFLSSNFNDSVDGDTGVLNPPHSGEAHSEVGGNISVPEPKVSSDWLHDGHIPLLTRIKVRFSPSFSTSRSCWLFHDSSAWQLC